MYELNNCHYPHRPMYMMPPRIYALVGVGLLATAAIAGFLTLSIEAFTPIFLSSMVSFGLGAISQIHVYVESEGETE